MKAKSPVALLGAGLLACLVPLVAHSAANNTGQSDEYLTIDQGMAPNRKFSITCHGEGDYDDNFHLYLMAEPGHKKIGPLEEVKGMDTAPEAFKAAWTANSRYVVLSYRSDRHVTAINIYRIQNRRAYPVTGPTPLQTVTHRLPSHAVLNPSEESPGFTAIEWLSPARFKMTDRASFQIDAPAAAAKALGKYGKAETGKLTDGVTYNITFSAEAICELTPGDHYRIVSMKPGKFDD